MIESKFTLAALFKNFSYVLVAFMSIGPEGYSVLALMMMLDTITGVLRAGVVHGWRSITSHEATLGIIKKGTAIVIPLMIAVAGHGVGLELVEVAKWTLRVLILSELYSTISNIQSIRLGRDVAEFDAVSYILEKIRQILERNIKKPNQK